MSVDMRNLEERLESIESLLLAQKNVLTLKEVANYTGISRSHLYKLTSTGSIPCYRPQGKHLYFDKDELDNWLKRNRISTNEELEDQAINYVTTKKGGVK